MEEKEFDFRFTMDCGSPIIQEEYTGIYIDLLPYKDGYDGCTYWDYDLEDYFCDGDGNELNNNELPPGFMEAFDEFITTDNTLKDFDYEYRKGMESYKQEQMDRYISEQMEASRYDN